jgi:hypothetical protein
MTETPAPDAVSGVEAALQSFRADTIGKLHPATQTAWDAFVAALVTNDAAPFVQALVLSTAKRLLGGFLGGIAAPGVEKSAAALESQLESDLVTPPAQGPTT